VDTPPNPLASSWNFGVSHRRRWCLKGKPDFVSASLNAPAACGSYTQVKLTQNGCAAGIALANSDKGGYVRLFGVQLLQVSPRPAPSSSLPSQITPVILYNTFWCMIKEFVQTLLILVASTCMLYK